MDLDHILSHILVEQYSIVQDHNNSLTEHLDLSNHPLYAQDLSKTTLFFFGTLDQGQSLNTTDNHNKNNTDLSHTLPYNVFFICAVQANTQI